MKHNYRSLFAISLLLLLSSSCRPSATETANKERAENDRSAKRSTVKLSDKENALAKQLAISSEALKIIKEKVDSQFFKVKMAEHGKWTLEDKELPASMRWTEENFKLVREAKNKYPELKPVIDWQFSKMPFLKSNADLEKLGAYKAAFSDDPEEIKYAKKLKEFKPYVAADFNKNGSNALKALTKNSYYDDSVTAKHVYEALRTKYGENKLSPEDNCIETIGFYLPLQNFGILPFKEESETIEELQDEIKSCGLTVYGANRSKVYEVSEFGEGPKSLGTGKNHDIRGFIRDMDRTVEFDPSSFNKDKFRPVIFQDFYLSPGVSVKKISKTKWLLQCPDRTVYSSKKRIVVIAKNMKPSEYIRLVGTDATKYSISNAQLVKQISIWDNRFGVRLISASNKNIVFKYKSCPEDIDSFITELFLISPDSVGLSPDLKDSALKARAFAQSLAEGSSVVLRWN